MKERLIQITFVYLVFCAIYSISTRLIPLALLCEGPAADILYKIVVVGGGIIALLDIIVVIKEKIKPDAPIYLLGAFVAVLGISTLLNRDFSFMDNIMGMATFVSQLIVFFLYPIIAPKKTLVKCLSCIGLFASAMWTIGCAGALYQYLNNIHYTTMSPEKHLIRQGIVDGRLFGLFSDPNFAAFTSLILIIVLLFFIKNAKSMVLKIYSIISIVLNVCYLIMSNSRTIFIAAFGTVIFFLFLHCYNEVVCIKKETTKKFILDFIKKCVICIIAMVAVFCIVFFPLRGIGQMMAPDRNVNDMVREDVNTDNITNNRSTIWKNYLTLYKDKPVFGFSVRSALPYATAKYPDSYLAQTQYVTHNGYLSLLIETGLVGFGIMAAFLILMLIRSVKQIQLKEKISDNFLLSATLTAAVLIFLMCFHDIFFTVNIETMLLYLSIGYIYFEKKIV